jgi:hypothetical protein
LPAGTSTPTISSVKSPASHEVSRRLPHGQRGVQRGQLRVHEPPSERGVDQLWHAARREPLGLGHDPRRTRHGLDPAGQHEVRLADLDGTGGLHDRVQAGRAQPVDRRPGDLDRQPCQQRAHAGDVAVVLAGLVGAPGDDLVDVCGVDAGALDHRAQDEREQVVGAHPAQCPAEPPHGGARPLHDERF